MDKRQSAKHYDRSAKEKRHYVRKDPKKIQAEKLAAKYQMDEASAMEIVHGVSTMELWLQREGKNSVIDQILVERIAFCPDRANFSPAAAIQILKGLYDLPDFSEEKILQISQKEKIAEMLKQYDLPPSVACKVLKGSQSLKKYLDREQDKKKRRQKAEKIHEDHPEIELATCYQIVDEGIEAKDYLQRVKTRQQRRETWYNNLLKDRHEDNRHLANYLQKLRNKKIKTMFSFFHKNSIMGLVVGHTPHTIKIKSKGGILKCAKLDMQYLTRAQYVERFLPIIEVDEELRNDCIEPAPDQQRRYQIPEKTLQKGNEVRLILGGGEIFQGTIRWFSRYDIKLSLSTSLKSSVLIFRHAVVAATLL